MGRRDCSTALLMLAWHYEENICHGVHPLLIAKFSDSDPAVERESGRVVLTLDGARHELSPGTAAALATDLGEVLTKHETFVHTIGERRSDGSYVVSRRGADSAGHRKVFLNWDALAETYDRLPGTFVASDLDEPGISGGRRHLLVRFFVEHPAFACELANRQPLTARKDDQ